MVTIAAWGYWGVSSLLVWAFSNSLDRCLDAHSSSIAIRRASESAVDGGRGLSQVHLHGLPIGQH